MEASQTAPSESSTSNLTVNTPLNRPPLSAQESREKRLANSQARFRNRGGIYQPPIRSNPLVDLLNSNLKSVNPPRARSRSPAKSPVRRTSIKATVDDDNGISVPSKAKGRKSTAKKVVDDEFGPIPGASSSKRAVSKKQKKSNAAPKKSTAKRSLKSLPDTVESDDPVSKPPTVLSNVRISRKSVAQKQIEQEPDTEPQRRKPPGKTKAAPSISQKRKGKEIQSDTDGKTGTSSRLKSTAVSRTKGKDSEHTSRSTKAVLTSEFKLPIPISSDSELDTRNSDSNTLDYPSSPLARKGKRRAATNSNYVEDDTERETEDTRLLKKPPKPKSRSAKQAKKPSKQQQPAPQDMTGETPKQTRARLVLTPVPEEPEPDTEAEREILAACLAQELADAISNSGGNVATISKDDTKLKGSGSEKTAVGKRKERRKNKVVQKAQEVESVVEGLAVEAETAVVKKDDRGLVADDEQVEDRAQANLVVLTEKEPKTTTRGKSRKRAKSHNLDDTNDAASEAEPVALASPSRTRKRARRAAETETVDDEMSPQTKKAKTVQADLSPPVLKATSGKTKALRATEPIQGLEKTNDGDTTSFEGNDNPGKKQNKRKRAAVTTDREVNDAEPTSKKRKEEQGSTRKTDSTAISEPVSPRLKTASRKQKENPTASKKSKPSADPAKKVAKPLSKKSSSDPTGTVKRGPPKSVLDRIKRSAALNRAHDIDDEPDELNLLP
ncbi:hypothetical protein F5878DRAFT_334312 [Lentinula raphanica]|uniref:Uncharacterized protein n=1 Tax=Lentinula raphanica TaxID=153919 RepID=A0AA38PHI4_9AGAR|nr:hypothetical protein F5878DRAFT_334312 [Lentinula raphanica]